MLWYLALLKEQRLCNVEEEFWCGGKEEYQFFMMPMLCFLLF